MYFKLKFLTDKSDCYTTVWLATNKPPFFMICILHKYGKECLSLSGI